MKFSGHIKSPILWAGNFIFLLCLCWFLSLGLFRLFRTWWRARVIRRFTVLHFHRALKKILFWCIFITVKEYKGNVFYIVLSDFACQIFRAKIVLHENFGCAVPWNSYKMWFRFPRSELTIKLIGLIHTTLDEFENAALFLRLGLPSTLLNRSRKRSFSITLFKFEEFENTGFLFRVGRKSFAKGAFWKRWPQDNHENCWGPPRGGGGACSLVP